MNPIPRSSKPHGRPTLLRSHDLVPHMTAAFAFNEGGGAAGPSGSNDAVNGIRELISGRMHYRNDIGWYTANAFFNRPHWYGGGSLRLDGPGVGGGHVVWQAAADKSPFQYQNEFFIACGVQLEARTTTTASIFSLMNPARTSEIRFDSNSGEMRLCFVGTATTVYNTGINGDLTLQNGRMHHIFITWGAAEAKARIWIDGVLLATVNTTGVPDAMGAAPLAAFGTNQSLENATYPGNYFYFYSGAKQVQGGIWAKEVADNPWQVFEGETRRRRTAVSQAAATLLTLTAAVPPSGIVGMLSEVHTVQIDGPHPTDVLVTPASSDPGDTFTPATETIPAGTTGAIYFQVTPDSTTGARNISITNDSALSNPAAVVYTANAAPTGGGGRLINGGLIS